MLYNRLLLSSANKGKFKVIFVYPEYNGTVYEDDSFETKSYKDSKGRGDHKATVWEISSSEDFSNIVFNSGEDTENLISIEVTDTGIEMDEIYYIRAKFISNTDEESEWSDILKFETYLFQSVINSWSDDMLVAMQGTS